MYEVNKPLVVEELDVLEPGPHEVLVRYAANGVCHSDLHVMTGDYPHPLPVVLGHEAAGVIMKVGARLESVKAGDHICSSYIPSCGRCSYCIPRFLLEPASRCSAVAASGSTRSRPRASLAQGRSSRWTSWRRS